MIKKRSHTHGKSRDERGAALIVALVLMAVVLTAFAVTVPSSVSAMRRSAAAQTRSDEKWQARSRAATGLAYFNNKLRSAFDSDMQAGRTILGPRVLPAFDDTSVAPTASRAVIVATAGGGAQPSGCESSAQYCTSILGNVDAYLAARSTIINDTFFTAAAMPAGTVGVAQIRTAERKVMSQGGETAYRVEYVLDARGGQNGRTRDRGEVVLGVNDVSCDTDVSASVPSQTITRGQSANITVNYTRARTLVLSAGGTQLQTLSVQDSLNSQTATFTVAPGTDTTYTITADGGGACTATTTHTVYVQAPLCPVLQTFDVTPLTLVGGGTVQVTWAVGTPYEVRLNGTVVPASGTTSFTINSTTTFTLTARDLTNQCPFTVTKTVTVLPCPSIGFFTADRTNMVRGDTVNLSWRVDNVAPGTRILINGADVTASGTMPVSPAATTDYTLQVIPPAGAICSTVQQVVRINVTPRPCPSLVDFSPSATSLLEGDTLIVKWNVADAPPATTTIHLTGGGLDEFVGAQGSRALTLAAGTYTFRLDVSSSLPECSTPISSQFSVTVNKKPPPPPVCDMAIQSFNQSASCVLPGDHVTFTWNVTTTNPGARVQINGAGSYPLSGSATFTVNSPQSFTLSTDAPNCSAQTATRFVDVAQPAPQITALAASPSAQPFVGQPVTITYGATGAQSATINGSNVAPDGSHVNPAGGSFTITATGPVDFTFAATSGGCSPQTAAQTIQIRPVACPVPVIQFFSPSPATVSPGGVTSFSWSIANAQPGATVSITGPGVNLTGLPASGTAPATMPSAVGTFFFTLTVANPCNPAQTVSQQTAVNVACPNPKINSFSISPSSYQAGTRSTIHITWDVTDASGSGVTVDISPGVGGGLPASGSMDVNAPSAPGTHTYTLTARNGCGASSAQFSVNVSSCPVPQIVNFTSSPPSFTQGTVGTVRLSWQVNDPTGSGVTVSIDNGVGSGLPATGFVDIVAPGATTTYTLTAATGCGSSASGQTTVTVNPATQPTPTPQPTPQPTPRGWQTDNAVQAGLAEASLDSELTENPDGSVTVHGTISALGITDNPGNILNGEITVTLIRDGTPFLVTTPTITVIEPGGFPMHEFNFTVPASQIPAGTNPLDMKVAGVVTGQIFLSPFTVHVSVDTTLPCGAQIPGDDPPFGFALYGTRNGQLIRRWVGAQDPNFLFTPCN